MYDNRGNGGGYCLLLMLGVGFIILPIIAVWTVLTDGWDNAPIWMRIVTLITLVVVVSLGLSVIFPAPTPPQWTY